MKLRQPARGTLPSTILVGVDETGLSDHAVRAGLELGSRLNAKVRLVHAVPVPLFEWMGSDPARGPIANEEMLKKAFERVDDHIRSLAGPRADQANGSLRVLPGLPAVVLLEVAGEEKADMIVLGDHRKRGLIDFGRTARAVLAKGTVPVWIQPKPVRRIEKILVPIDLSEDSLLALSSACTLARTLGASVRAAHLFDPASLYAERIAFEKTISAFDWQGVEHSAKFSEGDAIEGILDLSQSADLIVMGMHGRTGLASAVLGGVAYSVIKRSDRPVLAIPHPGRKFLL